MLKLVFLDFDGVLNCHEWDAEVGCGAIHQDKMFRLNVILKKTDAKVIVSSAWRYLVHRGEMNEVGFDWLLRSHGLLKDRYYGLTRKDMLRKEENFNGDPKTWIPDNERGLQIREVVENVKPQTYVVLDDLDLGIREHKHPFVQTNGKVGLQDGHVEQAVRILNGGVS